MAAILALSLPASQAANRIWVGPNASFWDIAANWDTGLPGLLDDALLGAFNTEIRSGAFSIHALTGTGQLTLNAGRFVVEQRLVDRCIHHDG